MNALAAAQFSLMIFALLGGLTNVRARKKIVLVIL